MASSQTSGLSVQGTQNQNLTAMEANSLHRLILDELHKASVTERFVVLRCAMVHYQKSAFLGADSLSETTLHSNETKQNVEKNIQRNSEITQPSLMN